jgi:iron complex transport system permease protein
LPPLVLASALLLVVAAAALTRGAAPIPSATAIGVLLERLPLLPLEIDAPATWERIVLEVRLPRVVAAGIVGAALGFAGASYQGVFRNPLAEPFLLGVSSGAALGAAIAILSPLPIDAYGFGWVPVFAFAGAALTVGLVYLLARAGAAANDATLILAGVALSAVLSAATSFLLLTGGEQARPIFSFLFGGFNTATWERIAIGTPYIVAGAVVVALHARVLDVLHLDSEQAGQLGVNVDRVRLTVLAAASLMAATAVAMAGIIGFVGLIVPHAVRMVVGAGHAQLLPLSALVGASLLIVADVLARTALAPQEVPVGIVTALAGGPFFLYLLRAHRIGLGPR